MNVRVRNTFLPIEFLQAPPDNPRKDVGDVTELAESIKVNGIFQNLTVIPTEDERKFTVVIGHRRLAAAKLAGLDYVPCMVAEMDEKEQISTMLLENMQRNDLTLYEQAQGFQMMLDLGETQEGISEKTGLSKATVRHRLKLLELDKEEFLKAQKRAPKMEDFIALEKIEDIELKNECLKEIGTNNFNWKLNNAISQEKFNKKKEEWLNYVSSRLEEMDYGSINARIRVILKTYYVGCPLDDSREQIDKYISDGAAKNFAFHTGYIYLIGGEKSKEPEEKPWEKAERQRKERLQKIKPYSERARQLRMDFVKSVGKADIKLERLIALTLTDPDIFNQEWDAEDIGIILGINTDCPEDGDYIPDDEMLCGDSKYIQLAERNPVRLILTFLSYIYDHDGNPSFHDYQGNYQPSERLERWYEILEHCGYELSDDEQALMDGTHECYGGQDDEENGE